MSRVRGRAQRVRLWLSDDLHRSGRAGDVLALIVTSAGRAASFGVIVMPPRAAG